MDEFERVVHRADNQTAIEAIQTQWDDEPTGAPKGKRKRDSVAQRKPAANSNSPAGSAGGSGAAITPPALTAPAAAVTAQAQGPSVVASSQASNTAYLNSLLFPTFGLPSEVSFADLFNTSASTFSPALDQSPSTSALPSLPSQPPARLSSALSNGPPRCSFDNLSQACEVLNINASVAGACQLITYHLRNKSLDDRYFLPTALQPTALQSKKTHAHVLDGIIYAELRDTLIEHQDMLNLDEFVTDFLFNARIHNDDSMDPQNWELSEAFVDKWRFCLNDSTVTLMTKYHKI